MKTLDLSQRLVLWKLAKQEGEDYAEVRDFCLKNKINIDLLARSIRGRYIDLNKLLLEEYLSDDDGYYSEDDYVILHDGTIFHRDDAFWCEGNDEYYSHDDMVTVYEGRSEMYYSREYIENNTDYHYYDGEYYDDRAMERNNLVYDCNGNIGYTDDLYYWESDGEWHHNPEEEEERYVDSYHSNNGTFRRKNWSDNPQFFIGFEIEKEDKDVKESINIRDFNSDYPLWRKERDGSLDDESGFELISPTYELDVDKIFEEIESNKVLKAHINAKKSNSCGGHINLSQAGLSGEQLFDRVKGYTPLIHALYWKRINKTYSKGKSNKELKEENEKYQSIKIHGNRIEYRIISAVPNVKTLKWRTKLLELILKNQTHCPKQAFLNIHTEPFLSLIKEMYTGHKLDLLIGRIVGYTLDYEGINVEQELRKIA